MEKLLIGLSVLLVLILSGCAPTSPSVPTEPSTKDTIVQSFKTDKKYANVYLCRNSFIGSAEYYEVFLDSKLAGETNAYSHFHWKIKPGQHIIQTKSYNKTYSLTLNTKANTNYFIMQQSKIMAVGMDIVEEEEGKKCVLATEKLKSQLHMSPYERKTSIVEPTYVSPAKYEEYSCSQISDEIEKINQRALPLASELTGIDRRNRNIMTIGLISLLQSAASEDEKVELGKLNGEYNALKTVAKQKKCKFASTL